MPGGSSHDRGRISEGFIWKIQASPWRSAGTASIMDSGLLTRVEETSERRIAVDQQLKAKAGLGRSLTVSALTAATAGAV